MQNKTPLKQIFVWLKINLPPSQYCKKINRLIEKIFPQFMFFSIHLDVSSIDNYPTFYFSSPPPPLIQSFLHPTLLSLSPPLSPYLSLHPTSPLFFVPTLLPFQILISYPNLILNIWLLPYSWYPGILVSPA